jgi:hypothetical protein
MSELVSPVLIDDIEFYISADGNESGMSISGLARLIGKTESSLRQGLISALDKSSRLEDGRISVSGSFEIPQSLEPFVGNVFSLRGVRGAKVISSVICSEIIRHFAFEEKLETALFAYKKFATIGLHQWIKQATHSIETKNDSQLLATMQEILSEVRDLKDISKRYTAIREKTSTYMAGTDELLNLLEDNTGLLPQASDGLFEDGKMSLEAWLYYKKDGLVLPRPLFRRLANIVAETYRSLVKDDPEKRHSVVAGVKKYNVSVYSEIHFPILQIALNKVLA